MISGYKNLKEYNAIAGNDKDPEKFWLLLSFFIGFIVGCFVTIKIIL